MSVYDSLVYSHLQYNILLRGKSADVQMAFIVRKSISRMIFSITSRSSCGPIFEENNFLTMSFILSQMFLRKSIRKRMRKILGLSSVHNYCTRSGRISFVSKHRTFEFKMYHFYQCMKLYNHLPHNIRSLVSGK